MELPNAEKEVQGDNGAFPLSEHLFQILDVKGNRRLFLPGLQKELKKHGLLNDDPRLLPFFKSLEDLDEGIVLKDFKNALKSGGTLVERALLGNLAIPDFFHFTKKIENIYNETKEISKGSVASYIPQLAAVSPEKFGVSICTVSGQRFSIGDSHEPFSIQSLSKPVNYCLALEEMGAENVHKYIGREPSGQGFNEITLDSFGRPHNPMINAGAIVSSSLIKPSEPASIRFQYVMQIWERLMGHKKPSFNNSVFLSEKQTADRNFALAYFIRENGSFLKDTDIHTTLDFYFQCCSIEISTDCFAIVAASLANSGNCPLTGNQVFKPENVKNCLSLLHSCGMYDFSGEWAFTIGLPAKSGVGGGLMVIIPNVMGIGLWSPPLDGLGNTVRGIEFCKRLVALYNFHHYDSLSIIRNNKKNPRLQKYEDHAQLISSLCWACAEGDTKEVLRLLTTNIDINEGNYDGRTPLHLAASEGHKEIVEILISKGANPQLKDRWGKTPLECALQENRQSALSILQKAQGSTSRNV